MKTQINMDKTQKDPSIKVQDYENLFVGIELEFNELSTQRAAEILGANVGHNRGQGTKKVVKEYAGAKIEVDVPTNKYKDSEFVVEVYPDGSVDTEVVCRPVTLKKIGEIGKIHKMLRDAGANFWSDGDAGFHMTFLTDPHKEYSKFHPLVVKNVMQLVRRFYPTLVKMFPGSDDGRRTRGMEYRQLPTYDEVRYLDTNHHTAVSLRRDADGNIWSFEIRIPDGTNNWDLVEKQVRFWMALIRQAAVISRYGLITFSQEVWGDSLRFYTTHQNSDMVQATQNGMETTDLLRILEPSLQYYCYNKEEDSDMEWSVKQQIVELKLAGESDSKIRQALKLSEWHYMKISKDL